MLRRLWTGRTGVGGTGGGSGACRRPRNRSRPRNISSSSSSRRWGRDLHSTTTRPSSSSLFLWGSSSLMSSSASVSFHAKCYQHHAALGSLTRRSVSSHHHSNPNDNDDATDTATATATATATRLSGRNTGKTNTNINTNTMVDYYQLFGYDTTPSAIPATTRSESDRRDDEYYPFELNLPDLKQRYLTLMLEYHPDKLGLQPPPHDEEAPDTTTTPPTTPITADVITQAYHILQHPHTRAEHLLDVLYQRPLRDEENRQNTTTTTTTTEEHEEEAEDPTTQSLVGMEFLMTMMEYRERIEDIVTGVHPTTTTTAAEEEEEEHLPHTHKKKQQQHQQQELLRTLADETKVLQHKCEAVLANVFRETTTATATATATATPAATATIDEARKLTAQLQYWYRLERTLKEALEI